MLTRLRRSMTVLSAAGATAIGVVLVLVSLAISERQLTEREQALFRSGANAIAFRLGTEHTIDWTWLSRMESDSGLVAHIEDNGAPMLYSGRGEQGESRGELVAAVKETARERYNVDAEKRPVSALVNSGAEFRVTHAGEEYRAFVVVMRTAGGHKSLVALGSTAAEKSAILRQRLAYLGLLITAVAGFLLFGWWFTGKAIRPVAESRKRQSEFIAAASHELRTPLAVIRSCAAAVEGRDGDRRFLDSVERECARTGKLVDDLLMLANADAGSWRMETRPVELPELLADCAEAFRAAAGKKNQTLTLTLPKTTPLLAGDELRLRQLAGVLLDNAVFYTPEGGRIAVTASVKGKQVFLEVADSGPGIPEAERERVFERFYRLDKVRAQKERYGLGLSIAKEIAELHRGEITLADTPGGGLTVNVRLPAGL